MKKKGIFGKKMIATTAAMLMGAMIFAGGSGNTVYVQAASDTK